jgi:hypothetical protein
MYRLNNGEYDINLARRLGVRIFSSPLFITQPLSLTMSANATVPATGGPSYAEIFGPVYWGAPFCFLLCSWQRRRLTNEFPSEGFCASLLFVCSNIPIHRFTLALDCLESVSSKAIYTLLGTTTSSVFGWWSVKFSCRFLRGADLL